MTGMEESNKKSKKFAVGGGDLPPSPTTSTGTTTTTTTTTTNKRATRHHVKRRSSGRVHVSKLAPMARAHSNNSNGELEGGDEVVRKPMKQSQSNKSLTRLSTGEPRKNGITGFTPAVITNKDLDQQEEEVEEAETEVEDVVVKTIKPSSPPTTPPPQQQERPQQPQPNFHVSHTIPAAPIEQTLSVTADDLVAPENTTVIKQQLKKPFLKSQFVEKKQQSMSNVGSAAIAQQPSGMTRTQQKILLQREQSLVHDENNIAHPKNMIRLTREMEKMGKEYRCVRKFQDPMMESLKRCCQQRPSLQPRTFSTSQLPAPIPHMEQRRQILLKTALQHQQQQYEQVEDDQSNRWSASQFLDRLFFGTS
ncbi:unnamed protein product [Mucor hiemalis]